MAAFRKLSQHTCHVTCHPLPVALAGEASTSFRLPRCVHSSVGKDLTHMSLPASEVATPPPSTVHSSEYESSWDPLLLSETGASGSDDSPCRAFHPLTYPRDGRLPSHDATGSDDFPAKPVVTMWEGIDEMGPWLRVKDTDRLFLGDRTVHWSPNCPFLSGRSFGLTQCYCADKLHKCFHYDVDNNFCLHGNSRCNGNVDVVAGVVWPVVVMCRRCCPFPVSPS